MIRRSLFVGLLAASSAFAHDVRGTVLLLDVGERTVRIQAELSVQQLNYVLPAPVSADALQGYVREHLSVVAKGGEPFAVALHVDGPRRIDDNDAQVVTATFTAPAGTSARQFTVRSDLIVHQVVTHNIYLFLRHDLKNARLEPEPELLGLLHFQQHSLDVDRGAGSWWSGFRAVFLLGTRHIAAGTDHLLFLFMLLLPASLFAAHRRWAGPRSVKASLKALVAIVTAFTLGHSLTLIVGAIGFPSLSTRVVEVAIAVSVLVSAVHAFRPLFAGREPIVAAAFGLVHGLAFAGALSGFGVDGSTLAVSVVGFNLGVEAMQLLIVCATMPWLLLLSRTPAFGVVRPVGAMLGGVASIGWVIERLFDVRLPTSRALEVVAAHGPWVIVSLAIFALVVTAVRRTPSPLTMEPR